mmetsp:Transcript_98134/g.192688  ORF Transcript_98134/g.192688 Transcript_98134/m.192688 type:complete len:217 (-) Transcript_98134:773-1423(-)
MLLGDRRLLHHVGQVGATLQHRSVGARRGAPIVLPEQPEGLPDALQAQLQILLGFEVILVLLQPQLVHLRLAPHERRQIRLQLLHVLLQAGGRCDGLVDARCQLGQVVVELELLLFCFSQLFITIRLLRGLSPSVSLQLGNHVGNHGLHLRERILAGGRTKPQDGGDPRCQLSKGSRVILARQPFHKGHDLGLRQVGAGSQGRARGLSGATRKLQK